MLKEEFERLVKKEVTVEEFEAWESTYMLSDADKFEFCQKVAPLVKGKPEVKRYAYLIGVFSPFFPKILLGEYKVNIGTGKIDIYNGELIDGKVPTYAMRVYPEQVSIKSMM